MKSRGVLIFGSILAALQFLAAASALADMIGKQTFSLFVILVGAIQIGWAAYQQGVVVPYQDVAALQNSSGAVVAGPAAGITNGKSVEVTRSTMGGTEEVAGRVPPVRDERGSVDTRTIAMLAFALVIIVILAIVLF